MGAQTWPKERRGASYPGLAASAKFDCGTGSWPKMESTH